MKNRRISRRRFLGQASCAAVGSSALLSTLFNLRMAGAVAQTSARSTTSDEYRALVCLFLAGGADAYNMIVPTGSEEYGDYAGIRADLALDPATLLPLQVRNGDGRTFCRRRTPTGTSR